MRSARAFFLIALCLLVAETQAWVSVSNGETSPKKDVPPDSVAASRPAPARESGDPNAALRRIKTPDTTLTLSIHGTDTTRIITVKPENSLAEINQTLKTMLAIDIASLVLVVASVVATFVVLN